MIVPLFTFGEFELNLRAEVLMKGGLRVRLASQPLKLLALLVRRAGDLVTREEIQNELWTKGSVVDFDHVVNQYIRQLRTVLGDSRDQPRFIETAPRRGYRFIAAVSTVTEATTQSVPVAAGTPESAELAVSLDAPDAPLEASPPLRTVTPRRWLAAAVITLAAASILAALISRQYVTIKTSANARANTSLPGLTPDSALAPLPAPPPAPPPTPSATEAQAAYIKGRYFFDQSTLDGYRKSCEYFQRSLDADRSYALAYKGMADCYMAQTSAGLAPADEAMPKARAMARKAIEIDNSLAEGHVALGVIFLNYDWNWPAARAELEKAVQMAPAAVDAHFSLASYYRVVGQVDSADKELQRAEALAPAVAKGYFTLGWLYVYAGRYTQAVGELQKAIELSPYNPYAHFGLFLAYDHTGRRPLAMTELQQYMTLQKETEIAARVARTYQTAGYVRARRQYFELMAAAYVQRHYLSYQIACEYASLGDKDRALDYLERAYQEHSNYMNRLKVDSYFDSLREEPRFKRLMEQMKLTDEQLASSTTLAAVSR